MTKLNWKESEDDENPDHQRSRVMIAYGWLTAEVYHTTRDDSDNVPWNAMLKGCYKNHALIGYESMEEAKLAVEELLGTVIRELTAALQ